MKACIFGCGKIANRVVYGFDNVDECKLVGFASKDINKAREYSLKYHLDDFGDYNHFLDNPSIDIVYICTYNLNHYDLIKSCLLHHKNVICEKPMVSTKEELSELFALSKKNNVLLMEALKSVFLPINIKIKELLKELKIGEAKYIEASFVRGPKHPEKHWIYDLKTGGALKDLGSYCVGTINFLLDKNPQIIYKYKNATEICADTYAELLLKYDDIKAHILVSNEIDGDSSLKIYGSNGYIVVPNFWKANSGFIEISKVKYDVNEEMINDFYYEIKHFVSLVLKNRIESEIMSESFSSSILDVTA